MVDLESRLPSAILDIPIPSRFAFPLPLRRLPELRRFSAVKRIRPGAMAATAHSFRSTSCSITASRGPAAMEIVQPEPGEPIMQLPVLGVAWLRVLLAAMDDAYPAGERPPFAARI